MQDIGKRRATRKAWDLRNREQRKFIKARNNWTRKCRILIKYGRCCVYCKTKELAILSIDHINDDGGQERKRSRKDFYRRLASDPRRDDLQILCMNCQYRKRVYGPDMSKWPAVTGSVDVNSLTAENERLKNDNMKLLTLISCLLIANRSA